MRAPLEFPDGKRFAFTIIDDPDMTSVGGVEPVYQLLRKLDMRCTKNVWPLACERSEDFEGSQTLEDAEYRDLILDLQGAGFELGWHCASMESSRRGRTLEGLRRFRELLGAYPRLHANHSYNRENMYWGTARLDAPLLRSLYGRATGRPSGYYMGHLEQSTYWWGDQCARHIEYTRGLTFGRLNVLRINPSMPYHDPSRPLVRLWYSACDAEDAMEFNALLAPERQEQLEREGGVCILATHFGKGFVENGVVHPETKRLLERLARRPGWFPTVGQLLDWMREAREDFRLPRGEWGTMQRRWARDLLLRRKWRYRRIGRRRLPEPA